MLTGRSRIQWVVGLGVALAFVALVVTLDPTYVLLGLVKNQSFFLGRPTGYWRKAISGGSIEVDRAFGVELGTRPNPNAIPVLIELLADDDNEVRAFASNVLVGLGSEGKPAVPVLLRLLEHPSLYDRRRAANALAAVVTPEDASFATPPLIHALKEEDAWVNYHSAIALGRMGAQAAEAVPSLIALAESERASQPYMTGEATVGLATSWALKQITSDASEKEKGQ